MKTIEQNPKYNEGIVSDLQEYIKSNSKILDIGCKLGNQLFPFIDFNPIKLVGIDNNEFNSKHVFRNFLLDRNNYRRRALLQNQMVDLFDESKTEKYWMELFPVQAEIFSSKFEFIIGEEKGNIENFEIKKKEYDIIIASKILHFFEPHEEEKIIQKLLFGLKKEGLLYISVNQFEKINFQNLPYQKALRISENSVLSYDERNPEIKWYLYTEVGIKKLISKFPKVKKIIDTKGFATEMIFEK
jgi:SAM-dependent methyltransferase